MSTASAWLRSQLPEPVTAVAARLRTVGGRAWLVGGAIRDLMLAHPVQDWDVATDLEPAALQRALPEADFRDLRLGNARLPPQGGHGVSVTLLRQEADYADGRHPNGVRFVADPTLDAARRDFTVNAIYLDLDSGALLDPTGGMEDLQRGVLRTIGDPAVRFGEDALRLLRAARLAGTCGLRLDAATRAAARAGAAAVALLSSERVLGELRIAMAGRGKARCLRAWADLALLPVVLPELDAGRGWDLALAERRLSQLPPGDELLAWAALFLHGPGQVEPALCSAVAAAALGRLRAPAVLRDGVPGLLAALGGIAALEAAAPAERRRRLLAPESARAMALFRADCLARGAELEAVSRALRAWRDQPPARLLSGADVVALGVGEGPAVGALLRRAEALAAEAGIADRAGALDLLARLVAARVKDPPPGDR